MNKSAIIVALLALALGAAGGYWFAGRSPDSLPAPATQGAEREPLFYRNPMNPEVTSPVPAKDSMGMDYVPVYADDSQSVGPAGTVRIDPVTVQNIGVRTARAERQSIARTINTVGRIDYDEQHLYRLHPKTEGWIEGMRIDTTGEEVRPGEILLSVYSPQLVSTQQEYILALRNHEKLKDSPFPDVSRGARELVENSLERLRLLDVPEHQIEELRSTREVKKKLHIHAPAGGIVTHVGVRDGQYITPKDQLYAIADLSKVWVLADIYEDELPWVRAGDPAEMTVLAIPGEVFRGELTYVYPYAESQTRTVKARLEFANPDGRLKPDMFANVSIRASARTDVITIPSEAIIRSGLREQVFRVSEPGRFEPREVVVGVSADGYTEIREGVAAGDEVVVSAQFLIDSESKLREATAKMQAAGPQGGEMQNDH